MTVTGRHSRWGRDASTLGQPPFPGRTAVTVSSFCDPLQACEEYGMLSGTVWFGGMTSSQVVFTGLQSDGE